MIRADELDDGLVLDGEIYAVEQADTEWGACSCVQGKHRFAGPWRHSRAQAEHDARKYGAHLVRRVVATTHTEEEL